MNERQQGTERCDICGHDDGVDATGHCRHLYESAIAGTSGTCLCKCVFPATDAPDYARGYVKGHKAGAQLATRAMLANVSRAEVVEAITDMQEGQDSHQQWLDHLSNPEREDCKGCDDHAAHVGDVEHHRQWIEKYDRAIRLLARVPLSEVATTGAGEGEGERPREVFDAGFAAPATIAEGKCEHGVLWSMECLSCEYSDYVAAPTAAPVVEAAQGDGDLNQIATDYVMRHKATFGRVSQREIDNAIKKVVNALTELKR